MRPDDRRIDVVNVEPMFGEEILLLWKENPVAGLKPLKHMVRNHQDGYPYINLAFFFFENIQRPQFIW